MMTDDMMKMVGSDGAHDGVTVVAMMMLMMILVLIAIMMDIAGEVREW